MSKFIAIDLDPQGLFVVAGSARGGHVRVENAFSWAGPDTEGGPPTLSGETARLIGEQLRDRLKAAGCGQAPVLFAVPRDRVVLKELRYPAVPPTEEPNVVRFQAIKEITDSPDEVIIDYVPFTDSVPGGERRSMAVVVRKELFNAIRQVCEAANLRLGGVTPRPYAVSAGLAHAFATSSVAAPDSKDDAVAILTTGPGGGEFTVVRAGEVLFTRTVPAPVLAGEGMLAGEVRRNLTMYAGSNPGAPVQALYLAEADNRWARKLRPALGIPVHTFDPLAGEIPAVGQDLRGRFAGAAGLLAAGSRELPINFASPRQPKSEGDPARSQILVAILAALVILGVGGALGFLSVNAAERDLIAQTKARDDSKKQWADLEPEAKRLAAAESWKNRRVVWLDELYDMTDRFPTAGGFHAVTFTGRAIPPDPKTGKQEHQAQLEVKVTAKDPAPVNTLFKLIDDDAVDPAPKNPKDPKGAPRFYVGADKTIGGPSQSEAGARDYIVFAKVNQRAPEKYVRAPASFTAPSRKGYPPSIATAKEREKEKEPEKEHEKDAPAPRPKEEKGK